MTSIHLNGYEIPATDHVGGGKYFSTDASQSNYILLQCHDYLSIEQHPVLERLKVQVLEYIPIHTYLCRYEPSDLDILRELPFVVSANVFHRDHVTREYVKSKFQIDAASREPRQEPPTEQPPSPGTCEVHITLHPGLDRSIAEVKDHLVEILNRNPIDIEVSDQVIRMALHPREWNTVAGIDEIRTIDEARHPEPSANLARKTLKIPGQLPNISQDALEGDGEIVAVADTGFDIGIQMVDSGSGLPKVLVPVRPDVPMFGQRLMSLEPVADSREGSLTVQTEDAIGHGTFVCGCVAASGTSKDFAKTFGQTTIKGTAPKAQLAVQALSTADGDVPKQRPYKTLFNDAYALGARIHNNSYGHKVKGNEAAKPYESSDYAATIDNYVRNTHPDMMVVIAAGNDQDPIVRPMTSPSIGEYILSKNSIVVGACESSRQLRYTANPTKVWERYHYERRQSNGRPDSVAAFSSRGPNPPLPNRPDLVAPGVCVYSTRTRNSKFKGFTILEKEDPPKYKYDPNVFGKAEDKNFLFDTGTSFSAPLVAGCCAVLRRALIEKGTPPIPSAMLIKALLINGATDLSTLPQQGRRGPPLGPPPDPFQGFGRVNLEASLLHLTSPNAGLVQGVQQLRQGDSWNTPITTNNTQKFDLTATMTYADYPGAATQAKLSLRCEHRDAGSTAIDSLYANRTSTTAPPDLDNNSQKLVWTNINPGQTRLFVRAHTMNRAADTQDFSLVWYVTYR